jgi:hypothetical protein
VVGLVLPFCICITIANMASAIELVDKADQESRGRNKFEHVPRGQRGDLFLRVEDDDASSIATTDDYIGLELEVEMQRRINKKRRTAACIMICMAMAIIGGVAYLVGGSRKKNTSSSSSTNTSPTNPSVTKPSSGGSNTNDNDGNNDDGTTVLNLWPTAAPLPSFKRCSPPRVAKEQSQKHLDVFHMMDFRVVPESPNKSDNDHSWDYTVSSMDISDDASLIAIGMSDFSADTDYNVGLVRAFGYDCTKHEWKQVGQDLLGTNEYEMFGHRISSSKDGTTMAVSAPQDDFDQGNGFVQVYYLDDNQWKLLGTRIENLAHTGDYTSLGHAINLSSKGETLAVLAVTGTNTYVIRVFYYDFNQKAWTRKGHDLEIQVQLAEGYEFDPQLSLSDEGDVLAMADPQFGLITYHFNFQKDKWEKVDTKMPSWGRGDFWIGGVDMGDDGNIVAFTAFEEKNNNFTWFAKVVDFTNNATELYSKNFPDFDTETAVAVSDSGQVVAMIEAKVDVDDDADWTDEQYVGSMTLITNQGSSDGSWRVIGKGTHAENIGILGVYVFLSGNGKIAAVGSNEVVSLYGIKLNAGDSQTTGTNSTGADTTPTDDTTVPATFEICAPFQDASANDHAGDIDNLPKQANQHTLSVAMSADGSVTAVGIDSYDGEDRGMVRVFGWDCSKKAFSQMGQNLFGAEEFDGFGQSVALSSDGKTLVVGANQPPPGRSGYVEVYSFQDDGSWKIVGKRLDDVESLVEDVGREVLISDDGSVVTYLGSIVKEESDGWHDTSSFIRAVENVNGEWKAKGEDLIASVAYDDYGHETHVSLSGDGTTLAVTGSYSSFVAKVYSFDAKKQNWTEFVVPPIKTSENDNGDYDCLDDYFDSYFSGSDVALNKDGTFLAVTGTKFVKEQEVGVVRVLAKNATTGNYTLAKEPVDYLDVYAASSVGMSSDGKSIAVGINTNEDDKGALFVTTADDSDSGWNSRGKVDGRGEDDLLGSRVTISRDGTIAAASSRKGYVSFFKLG